MTKIGHCEFLPVGKMVRRKRPNGKSYPNQCQLVDLSNVGSFCHWQEKEKKENTDTRTKIVEEPVQNETKTSETKAEPQSFNENREVEISKYQMLQFMKMTKSEVENLYKYSSGIQEMDIFDLSRATIFFKIRFNLLYKVVSENIRIQEYEIILKSQTLNNNTENELSIFVYRDKNIIFLWHYEYRKYERYNVALTAENIDVKYWVHRINYQSDVANDEIVKKIYPGYNHSSYLDLFCKYLDTDDKVFKGKMNMSRYDVLTVYLEKHWLNDQAINKYFGLIKQRSNSIEESNLYVFDSFFFTIFKQSGYDRVQRCTKKIDIFSFKKLMIPVHIDDHWLVICIDVILKKIFYYDSYSPGKDNRVATILNKVTNYLRLEHFAKKGVDFNTDELRYLDGGSPVQDNSHDCGVFTCINGELFSRDELSNNFNHTHINLYRQKIVYELLNQELIN